MPTSSGALLPASRALSRLNSRILKLYDRRTVAALDAFPPLRPVLRHLGPLLTQNLSKEIRKDALAFAAAAQALRDSLPPSPAIVNRLLEAGRAIDQDFLAHTGAFPVRIVIRYEDVLPLRRRRIEALLNAARRILGVRAPGIGVLATIRAEYDRPEFERALLEVLGLYTQEARALSRAVKLPLLLVPLREIAAERLYEVMNEVGRKLSRDAAARVFQV